MISVQALPVPKTKVWLTIRSPDLLRRPCCCQDSLSQNLDRVQGVRSSPHRPDSLILPSTVAFGFFVIHMMGFQKDFGIVMGMVFVVGKLLDDSIVVVEVT